MYKNYIENKLKFIKLNNIGGYIDKQNIQKIYSIIEQKEQKDILLKETPIKNIQNLTEILNNLEMNDTEIKYENLKYVLPLINHNPIYNLLNIYNSLNPFLIVQINNKNPNGINMLIDIDELTLEPLNMNGIDEFVPTKILYSNDKYKSKLFNLNLYLYGGNILENIITSLFKNFNILDTIKENFKKILPKIIFDHNNLYNKLKAYTVFLSQFYGYRINSNSIKYHDMNTIITTFIMLNKIDLLYKLMKKDLDDINLVIEKIGKDKKLLPSNNLISKLRKININNVYLKFTEKIIKLIPIDTVYHIYNHVILSNNHANHKYGQYKDKVILDKNNIYKLFIYDLYIFITIFKNVVIYTYEDKIPNFCYDIIHYYCVKSNIHIKALKNKFLLIDLLNNISIDERINYETYGTNDSNVSKQINIITDDYLNIDNASNFILINYNIKDGKTSDGQDYKVCVESAILNLINYVLPRDSDNKMILDHMNLNLVTIYNKFDRIVMTEQIYKEIIQEFVNLLATNDDKNITYNQDQYNIQSTYNNILLVLKFLFPDLSHSNTISQLLTSINNQYIYNEDDKNNIIINNKYKLHILNYSHAEFMRNFNNNGDNYYSLISIKYDNNPFIFIYENCKDNNFLNNYIGFMNIKNKNEQDKIQQDKIQQDKIQQDKIQQDKNQDKIQQDKIQQDKIQQDKIQQENLIESILINDFNNLYIVENIQANNYDNCIDYYNNINKADIGLGILQKILVDINVDFIVNIYYLDILLWSIQDGNLLSDYKLKVIDKIKFMIKNKKIDYNKINIWNETFIHKLIYFNLHDLLINILENDTDNNIDLTIKSKNNYSPLNYIIAKLDLNIYPILKRNIDSIDLLEYKIELFNDFYISYFIECNLLSFSILETNIDMCELLLNKIISKDNTYKCKYLIDTFKFIYDITNDMDYIINETKIVIIVKHFIYKLPLRSFENHELEELLDNILNLDNQFILPFFSSYFINEDTINMDIMQDENIKQLFDKIS
jgi:hypothetical protein